MRKTLTKTFFLAGSICIMTAPAFFAQSPLSASVQFSDSQTRTVSDFSESLPMQPNDVVNVTLQFAAEAVGQTVTIEPSNGASVSTGSNIVVIGADGRITFAFHAPVAASTSAVAIKSDTSSTALTFSVSDTAQQ
jgi:hypothetical protein